MSNLPPPFKLPPDGFPDDLFETAVERIGATIQVGSFERENFVGGYNGVRYRLRACADDSECFTRSLRQFGEAPTQAERYNQERWLFGFFVSGFSALESFCYCMYFAATQMKSKPAHFQVQKPGQVKAIDCASTGAAFRSDFPTDDLTTALTELNGDPQFKEWKECRNFLLHRATPGRAYQMKFHESFNPNQPGAPFPPVLAAEWRVGSTWIPMDDKLTSHRLKWLLRELTYLVTCADRFARDHF
jgi:hypothetical protein